MFKTFEGEQEHMKPHISVPPWHFLCSCTLCAYYLGSPTTVCLDCSYLGEQQLLLNAGYSGVSDAASSLQQSTIPIKGAAARGQVFPCISKWWEQNFSVDFCLAVWVCFLSGWNNKWQTCHNLYTVLPNWTVLDCLQAVGRMGRHWVDETLPSCLVPWLRIPVKQILQDWEECDHLYHLWMQKMSKVLFVVVGNDKLAATS